MEKRFERREMASGHNVHRHGVRVVGSVAQLAVRILQCHRERAQSGMPVLNEAIKDQLQWRRVKKRRADKGRPPAKPHQTPPHHKKNARLAVCMRA
eukprot:352277-Chlamydomonas_euryale.AAC.7